MTPRNDWFTRFGATHSGELRVFCFPYAGGNSSVFSDWLAALPPAIELWAATYPGRIPRFNEASIASMPLLIEALLHALPLDKPFVLFGHSLGGTVAFELLRALQRSGLPLPQGLFVSATRPPHFESALAAPPGTLLTLEQCAQQLKRLAGTPPAVLENRELLALLLPMLQADFALANHQVTLEPNTLQVPVFACGGAEDEAVPPHMIAHWAAWAGGPFTLQTFNGGHFYMNDPHHGPALLQGLLARWQYDAA